MKAFILVNTELGKESKVTEVLMKIDEIKNIYGLYGLYDLIIEIEADTMDRIKEVTFNNIRQLIDVKSTITLLTYGDPLINK